MSHLKRARSLSDQVAEFRSVRARRTDSLEQSSAEGWSLVDISTHHLQYIPPQLGDACAIPNLPRQISPVSIFSELMSESVLEVVMKNWALNPGIFTRGKGANRSASVLQPTKRNVWNYLAIRVYIQGVSRSSEGTVENALRNATKILGISSFVLMRMLHTRFVVRIGTEEERELSHSFSKCIRTFGEAFAGDEKLFRFTGLSGFIRQCPSKPARIGIWHFQACVTLPSGRSYLVWTRAHMTPEAHNLHVTTTEIVREWCALIQQKSSGGTMLVFDSYYLSKASREVLLETGTRFLAAVRPDRFLPLKNLVGPVVTKSGEAAFAHNSVDNTVCTFYWSLDKDVGKKMVISNAFSVTAGKRAGHSVPVFDEYKFSFNKCDLYNQVLHVKVWPFRSGGGHPGADILSGWNYLFSCTLLKAWALHGALKMQSSII